MTRSFRFQLALRATGGVAVGILALSVITLLTLRAVLDRELNASILAVASIQAASLADGVSGEMHFHEWELTPREADSVRDLIRYAQVWGENGESLLRSQFMTSDLPWNRDAFDRAAAGELIWIEQEFEGSRVRTLLYPLERLGAAHEAHVLEVAAPLTARNEMLVRAGSFFAALTLLLAGATFAGSWWLADRAVRPIHEIIDQAEAVEAGSLDKGIQTYAETAEYRRLVDVLNTMLRRIRTSFEAQKRFTSDASHELRSPLTAMRGEIELALRRARRPEEYVATLESTHEEVVRLSEIAGHLLMLARSDAGALQPNLKEADLTEVVTRVVDRLRPRAEAKAVHLCMRADGPIPGRFDGGLLSQAVWNLIDNALKFAPRDSVVEVVVRARAHDLSVEVDDAGPGLGSVDSARHFERFFRADESRTRGTDVAGTGLGLAIVKAIAEAHGGRASAEDRAEGGARFSISVPRAPASRNA